tara:strand:- start:336 stop:503 length:168 start_codon:yes stop_codon:yes gene_type:complete
MSKVTKQDVEDWLGRDEKGDYPFDFVLQVLCELANGEYEQETFKKDVIDIRGNNE